MHSIACSGSSVNNSAVYQELEELEFDSFLRLQVRTLSPNYLRFSRATDGITTHRSVEALTIIKRQTMSDDKVNEKSPESGLNEVSSSFMGRGYDLEDGIGQTQRQLKPRHIQVRVLRRRFFTLY